MSKTWTPEIIFTHDDDCQQRGCPGHKFQLELNHTVNSVDVLIDGDCAFQIPMDILEAIIKEYKKWEGEVK